MNEKITNTITEMKKQTIGVEVEMNHITRKKASEVAADYFGTGRWDYTGDGCYKTWSAWDERGREWKFMRDSSINGDDDEKCELVTPILNYDDIPALQGLIRALRKAGAKSDATRGCGVHIHIGALGHTAGTLRNLANIMAKYEDLLTESLKLNRSRLQSYCRPVDTNFLKEVNTKKPQTMADLADIWYNSQYCTYGRTQHYNQSRYHMLNLHATFTKGTVEFRLFQFDAPTADRKGGLHAGQLKAYIQLCLAMSQMAKEVKNTSAKKQVTDNPKFAMRIWLKRMGMLGEEFETAREILTKNLSGDSSYRHGRNVA